MTVACPLLRALSVVGSDGHLKPRESMSMAVDTPAVMGAYYRSTVYGLRFMMQRLSSVSLRFRQPKSQGLFVRVRLRILESKAGWDELFVDFQGAIVNSSAE
jgi:hypothetical protein